MGAYNVLECDRTDVPAPYVKSDAPLNEPAYNPSPSDSNVVGDRQLDLLSGLERRQA